MAVPHGKGHARQIWVEVECQLALGRNEHGGNQATKMQKAYRLGRRGDKVGVIGEIAQVDQPERVAEVFVVDDEHRAPVLDGELVHRDAALLSRTRALVVRKTGCFICRRTARRERDNSRVESGS